VESTPSPDLIGLKQKFWPCDVTYTLQLSYHQSRQEGREGCTHKIEYSWLFVGSIVNMQNILLRNFEIGNSFSRIRNTIKNEYSQL
jgi:hypothetical protein